MRKFNKREKILIGSFLVVLLFYIVSTYWISPIIEKIDELKRQQVELKIQWDEIKNWVGQEEKLYQHVSAMETEVNQLVERIPPANQSALYWNAFNQIAIESGVALTRMVEETTAGGAAAGGTVQGDTGETAIGGTETGETGAGERRTPSEETVPVVVSKTWSVTMAVSGPEAAVMEFLNRLETMHYVTAVKTVAFAYQDTSVIATFELILGAR